MAKGEREDRENRRKEWGKIRLEKKREKKEPQKREKRAQQKETVKSV